MTKIAVHDLETSKTLDLDALRQVKGGHGIAPPADMPTSGDFLEFFEKYLGSLPDYPMPEVPDGSDHPFPCVAKDPLGGPF